MSSTTIKIDNPLLNELKQIISKDMSISAFVREILEKEVQKRKMIQAAEQYAEFLKSNPQEQEWLNEWEAADLAQATSSPKTKGKR